MESLLRAELEIKKELREIVRVNVMSIVGGAGRGDVWLWGSQAGSILLNVKTRNDKSRENENNNLHSHSGEKN